MTTKYYRLSQAARKLNVRISDLANALQNNNIPIDDNPNSKITDEQYLLLVKYFSK